MCSRPRWPTGNAKARAPSGALSGDIVALGLASASLIFACTCGISGDVAPGSFRGRLGLPCACDLTAFGNHWFFCMNLLHRYFTPNHDGLTVRCAVAVEAFGDDGLLEFVRHVRLVDWLAAFLELRARTIEQAARIRVDVVQIAQNRFV